MNKNDVLTNLFEIEYVDAEESLLIKTVNDGVKAEVPIRLRLETLQKMGPTKASAWVGESVLLLIPTMREKLFKLDD